MKHILFNPFEKYPDRVLIPFGLFFSVVGVIFGYIFNARYDGIIDLHFVEKVNIYQPIFEICVNIFCASISLFVFGKLINNKTRLIDLISVFMLARAPLYLLTVFNINGTMFKFSSEILGLIDLKTNSNPNVSTLLSESLVIIFIFSIFVLVFTVWFFALLWNGFKVATNAKGNKAVVFFVIAIILSEILSKIIIYSTNL